MLAPRGQRRVGTAVKLTGAASEGDTVAEVNGVIGAVEGETAGELDVTEGGELLWLMVRQYYDEFKRLFQFIER
jgi:hypothetical protein